jgi:hypothetical protein
MGRAPARRNKNLEAIVMELPMTMRALVAYAPGDYSW